VSRSTAAFSGVVLAAGRSSRMGREKALLEIDGIPLWQRQRDVLAAAGAAEIFLSARPDQSWAWNAQGFTALIHDAMPSSGPIAGISSALERASHPFLAVIAVDLPAITADWFRGLLAACTTGCGVVGRRGEAYEPLAAVYPREIKWRVWEALAGGQYSLQELMKAAVAQALMRERQITAEEVSLFANWNREADLT
jgi:molybdopterin-guanine dinucleotide biosynthesis protein A